MSLLEVSGLSKTYTTRFGGAKVEALKSVTFSVESGEYVAVMGESGSGKTTLLNLLAALDRPTGGMVLLGGQNLAEIPEERAAAFRRDHLGFVFQDFSLLDTFSLEDNILLPLVLQGKSRGEMKSRLVPLADRLGISDLLKKYPYEVSGGQKQRAAVARALITRPQVLFADEPTGALDSGSTEELLRLFGTVNGAGQTIVMVTHSVRAASCAGRVLFLRDGAVAQELTRGTDTETAFYRRIADALTASMQELYRTPQGVPEFREKLDALDASMNNFSLILRLTFGKTRILLPGDTNRAGYGGIPPEKLAADIFKVGHHGQLDGADAALVNAVRPRFSVCCASSDRRYNSAHPDTMRLLKDSGAELYFSDCPRVDGQSIPPHRALEFTICADGASSARYLP